MKGKVALVLLIILLSGCSMQGTVSKPVTSTETTTTTSVTTQTPSNQTTTTRQTSEETSTTTTTTDEAGTPRNPWESDPITVAITQNESDRNFRPHLEQALAWWEENGSEYTPYELNFTITNSSSADIEVRFVETIEQCGHERDPATAGCADYIPTNHTAQDQSTVRVETKFNDTATIQVLKHEFGHTVGLEHEDSSILQFMKAETVLGELDQLDVGERRNKFQNDTVHVYVDYSGVEDQNTDEYRRQVREVLKYYNDEPVEGLDEDVVLERVDTPEEAEIRIYWNDSISREETSYRARGYDPDLDERLEYYEYVRIDLSDDIKNANADLYTGYYVGFALYANSTIELPNRYEG